MQPKFIKIFLISSISGFSAIFIYICLAIVSWHFYPGFFNPAQNWLSDLGHIGINSYGSIYYRLAAIIPGILIILFYLFIYRLIEDNRKKIRIYTWIVKILGMFAGFSFIISGIFPINNLPVHSLWSKMMFISWGTSIIFTGIVWLYKKTTRRLSIITFIIAAVDISSSIFTNIRWLEWILVALILIYIFIVSTRNLISYKLFHKK